MLLSSALLSLLLLAAPSIALPGDKKHHQGPRPGKGHDKGKPNTHHWNNHHEDHHADPELFFYAGHDLSSLKIQEDGGYIYRDSARNNSIRPVEDILGDGGMNTVRLRLWVDPIDIPYDGGYYEAPGLNYTLGLAKRMYDKGYKIYLDYHFSSYWADPNKQFIPNNWPTTLEPMALTLRSYVTSTLQSFAAAGIDLSIVSLGNEIRHGTLWPVGQVDVDVEPEAARIANFTGMGTLYAAARNGVRDAVAAGVRDPLVMIHIDNGWNQTLQERWFSSILATGLVEEEDWDVFGFSMYPFYGTGATFENLQSSLNYIAETYGKPIHVVETDWPAICNGTNAPELSEPGIPASVPGQLEWVAGVVDVVKNVPYGLGQGINYWEPAWLNNTGLGSNCSDSILFRPDWSQWPEVTAYSRESVNMFADL